MIRFAFQIFLSAFLLFQVQPIVARFILPDFGGASNVWTVCLVFFQVFLLVGYTYAYLLDRWFSIFNQAVMHSILVLVTLLVFLPLNLSVESHLSQSPQLGIVFLLITSVGLPYALVASSGPLFQNWFRSRYPQRNTYRLYALSNIGSLLGLLSYPFVIEPLLSLNQQSLLWSAGFGFYFLWTLACLYSLRRVDSDAIAADQSESVAPIRTARALVWVSMASIATMLLLATTNKITLDVASVPFLWILPLTLYLLSFIICFDRPAWYVRKLWVPLLFALSIAVFFVLMFNANTTIYAQIAAYLSMLFVGCMVCHGELHRLRPNAKQLTRYYLFISLGGAMGGVFVALIAPLIFNDYYELQLSWVALLLIAGLCSLAAKRYSANWIDIGAQLGCALWIGLFSVSLVFQAFAHREDVIEQIRGFYGVLKIRSYALPEDHPGGADRYLLLQHGVITHGTEYYKDDSPLFVPTSYFGADSGIGLAIGSQPIEDQKKLDVGVIGMGVASISALCEHCRSLSFYEIDPNVVAMEEKWFSALSSVRDKGVETNVFIGDGRKLLESQLRNNSEPQYDILTLDAFSGDSIPVHLLTREAFSLYFEHIRTDGILAIHISNKHLDLFPVVTSIAADLGVKAAKVIGPESAEKMTYLSKWVVLSNNDAFFANIESAENVEMLEPKITHLWTDEYSNLLSVLH